MPPKKSPASAKAKASAKPSAVPFRSPVTPILPVQPLKVAAPTATMTETNIALSTLIVCCLAVMAAFAAQMMAGIVGVTNSGSATTKVIATTATSTRATTTPSCVDSDFPLTPSSTPTSTINYFIKGTVIDTYASGQTKITDYCKSTSTLVEMYCDPKRNNHLNSVDYRCPYGCREVDGACRTTPPADMTKPLYPTAPTTTSSIPNNPPKCTDSDSGKNFYTAGIVVNSTSDPSSSGSIPDSCLIQYNGDYFLTAITSCSPAMGNCYVEEVYCNSTSTSGYSYSTAYCPKGCNNKACIR